MRFLPLLVALLSAAVAAAAEKPNIIFILADDLGIGDVRCFNPEGKIATPNMDKLAAGGMKFTDAHTPSAVCTPTRYGVITGRYNWRTKLQRGVLGGLSPRLIEEGRLTVAQMLRDNGYATACVGKWHLGMDWAQHAGKTVEALEIEKPDQVWSVDFTKPIANGPTAVGFDYYFGIAASLDMVPYTFIENDRVTKVPTKEVAFPMMTDRENGGLTRKGPAAEGFEVVDVLPTLAGVACDWITTSAKSGRPFFLYLPLNAPHTPINPLPEWKGKSGLNAYGDYVMQVDAAVGKVLAALEESGAVKNTLVVLTSDNGCSPSAKFEELLAKGHNPSAGFRGHKADIFEGGHRVPFIVRWPGKVTPGGSSADIVCLTDFMATAAEVVGAKIPAAAAEDSVSFLPALLGKDGPKRTTLVSHSINGSFAIREGNMKLCLCAGSGGWSVPKPGSPAEQGLPPDQLFDLAADRAETKNLAAEKPDVVKHLGELLDKYVADGRSTPGQPQKNAVEIKLRKETKAAKKKGAAAK
ncbi:MAG: arylsulfatase [Chthoniobacteraceae bacterium]